MRDRNVNLDVNAARLATMAVLFCNGLLYATWGVSVPLVKDKFALRESTLALALAMVAVAIGGIVTMAAAGRWIARTGSGRASWHSGLAMALVAAPILLMPNYSALLVLLFAYGTVTAANDVAANAQVTHLEKISGRSLIGSVHGSFSVGGLMGSLIASAWSASSWSGAGNFVWMPAYRRAQAIGYVMLGLAAANVIGVPVATWLGQAIGWRSAFGAVGLGCAMTAAMLLRYVPHIAAEAGASALTELGGLQSLPLWLTLGVACIGFGGMFAVYSYITPTLTEVTGLELRSVPMALATWGMGMIVGNLVGGWLADRALIPAIFGMLVWNIVFLALFSVTANSPTWALVTLFLIGNGFSLVPALQAHLMQVAGKAQTLAAALNHSAFNASNAIGATLGGMAIAKGLGWAATGWVGGGLAFAGLMMMVPVGILASRNSRASAKKKVR